MVSLLGLVIIRLVTAGSESFRRVQSLLAENMSCRIIVLILLQIRNLRTSIGHRSNEGEIRHEHSYTFLLLYPKKHSCFFLSFYLGLI